MGKVTFVLGKGGVGRTTVARALALALAKKGPTLLVEPGAPAHEERLSPTLTIRTIDPKRLLDKAVRRLMPLGPIATALTKHPAYESFTEIAPALRELAFIDAVDQMARGRGLQVVVDGPATGHGLNFLQAPAKATEILVGHLRSRAEALRQGLLDHERSQVLVVTIPAELPVLESIELVETLRTEGFHVPGLVANRVPPPVPFDVVRDHPKGLAGATPAQALTLLQESREEAERWLDRLRSLDERLVTLPFVPTFDEIEERLAPHMEVFA